MILDKLTKASALIEHFENTQRWINYQLVPRVEGRIDKVPCAWNGDLGTPESFPINAQHEKNWSDFKTARERLIPLDKKGEYGIGFVLCRGGNTTVIDIDYPKESEPGHVAAFERVRDEVLARFPDTYAETSVSGKGVHIWVLGQTENIKSSIDGVTVEMYSDRRYMTVTGDFLAHRNIPPKNHQEALTALYEKLTADKAKIPGIEVPPRRGRELSRHESEKHSALMAGIWKSTWPSQSEADFALCRLLAKKHGTDAGKINEEFRASGLFRDKWERTDYREETINAAIASAWVSNAEPPEYISDRCRVTFSEREPKEPGSKGDTVEEIPLCGNSRDDEQICGRCQRSLITPVAGRTTGCVIHGLKPGPGTGWFGFGKISMIAGLSGSGKTYWLDNLLDDVRNGKEFLGHKTTQCEYLVLLRDRSLEDAGETWMQQFGLRAEYRDFKSKFPAEFANFSAHYLELTEAEKNAKAADVIDKYARLHPEVRIIAVEGLDLWIPSKMIDPDKTELELRQLQNVAKKRGLAIIGTLGSPKVRGQDAYVGRDNLYGSTITGRMSDTVVVINKWDRADEGSVRVFDVLLRRAKAERFYFYWVDGIFQEVPEPGTANGAGRLPGETDAYVQLWDITRKHFRPGVAVTFYPLGPSWVYGESTFKKFRQWASGKEVGRLVQNGGNYYVNASHLPGVEHGSSKDDSSPLFEI